jgi:hypothetical protein
MITLPWYIAGPLIGLIVPILLIVRKKQFGISSSFRVVGSYLLPRVAYFRYPREKDAWQVFFVLGIALTAFLVFFLSGDPHPESKAEAVYAQRAAHIYELASWPLFLLGGLLVGFGARYADGCTAGHCIMGNAQFAWASLLTTIAFFIGGLVATYFILPQFFTP